jgi:hypothetical protein
MLLSVVNVVLTSTQPSHLLLLLPLPPLRLMSLWKFHP